MKVIALVNQKGGVAKTTTAASLAWGLAKHGKKVLAIDFDPQGNLTSSMGASDDKLTALEWIGCNPQKSAAFSEVVQTRDGVDIIPTNLSLAHAEVFMQQKLSHELILSRAIKSIPKKYDYIIVDSPPSLGLLTINILSAADELIVPLKPEWLCYQGAAQLIDTVREVKEAINSKLKINGFLITMADKRRKTEDILDLIAELAGKTKSKLYKSQIRMNVAAADAPSYCTSIYDYKSNSPAAVDYTSFVKEFLEGEIK